MGLSGRNTPARPPALRPPQDRPRVRREAAMTRAAERCARLLHAVQAWRLLQRERPGTSAPDPARVAGPKPRRASSAAKPGRRPQAVRSRSGFPRAPGNLRSRATGFSTQSARSSLEYRVPRERDGVRIPPPGPRQARVRTPFHGIGIGRISQVITYLVGPSGRRLPPSPAVAFSGWTRLPGPAVRQPVDLRERGADERLSVIQRAFARQIVCLPALRMSRQYDEKGQGRSTIGEGGIAGEWSR
jgi:hypothetical protein